MIASTAMVSRRGGPTQSGLPPRRTERPCKVFGEDDDRPIEVVEDITFSLAEGEVVSIVGPPSAATPRC
jgi:ABC-type polysaccharide/polyol phosphate transport system ATPase subunit